MSAVFLRGALHAVLGMHTLRLTDPAGTKLELTERHYVLIPTEQPGRVAAILVNTDRAASLASARVDSVRVTYEGFEGDAHGGLTRASCTRVRLQYSKGTEIRNVRQISILSVEEMQKIAQRMDIDTLEPEWIGANLVLSGIPDLTLLPPSTRLIFNGGVALVVDMENRPCKYPGEIIDRHYPGKGSRFPRVARHLRGVTAWVERPGVLSAGEAVTVHLPVQPAYPHMVVPES